LVALREDAQMPSLDATELRALQAILEVSDVAPKALTHLREIAADLPAISSALDQLEARLNALTKRGVDVDRLNFSGAYGRTTMEYYDGFVFGFHADTPIPVATGGRYDALTRVLGQGREIPAVGGVIRPEMLEALT
jgi:ATP phosphoribosyltransferase regulatory subunit